MGVVEFTHLDDLILFLILGFLAWRIACCLFGGHLGEGEVGAQGLHRQQGLCQGQRGQQTASGSGMEIQGVHNKLDMKTNLTTINIVYKSLKNCQFILFMIISLQLTWQFSKFKLPPSPNFLQVRNTPPCKRNPVSANFDTSRNNLTNSSKPFNCRKLANRYVIDGFTQLLIVPVSSQAAAMPPAAGR